MESLQNIQNNKFSSREPVQNLTHPHIETLRKEFERRRQRHPKYSLRRFARHLKMDPSRLCRILAGKRDLSAKSAQKILSYLTLNEEEREIFKLSVIEHTRQKAASILVPSAQEGLSSSDFSPPIQNALHSIKIRLDSSRMNEVKEMMQTFARALESIYGNSGPKGSRLELTLVACENLPTRHPSS